ncbi:aspartyl-tRNA(Asn)/glutamyl-tRNA(Gln) amidotransferase subunit A [Angulomicrobium tetraedrale]|uniref:Aspartyl-tRNA(Asn)/glutamyl-tRNA(Gln) amidotransferase subunit A n=1 Tax=Ancylobacter tetraedralis TaxID=217068 RepID=A0A839ZGD2_9HYPH|nr:amidase family protein [Ancylobacter tetraedralis]MBB3773657.1 aspartyl-tRNA(Asn)/glutamyl-tRNA(Gln) amidotransferase subunit A [Ancylobacter tetraedralis]
MPESLDSLAAALTAGRTDAVQLVERALERAQACDAVFITLMAETALAQAHAARTRRAQGRALSPYDGIPIAWKDLFDISGTRTSAGSRTRDDVAPATVDAPVVAATRRLGFIALGKTNLSEFAFSGLGANPHFGTPTADLPVNEPRMPGGSSSGSAVAVQRGIVPAAIGTDTAGSVRVPAAFTGCVGYKASQARYDMTGVFPLAGSLDSLGPLAGSVAECAIMDAAMRGQVAPPLAPARPVLVVDDALLDDPDITPPVRAHIEAVIAQLARLAPVRRQRIEPWHRAREAIARLGWLGAYEARALHLATLTGPRRELIDPRVVSRLDGAARISGEAAAELRAIRAREMGALADTLDGGLLVLPTVRHVAPPLAPLEADPERFARVNVATLALTMVASFLDMPGVALPTGRSVEGLPFSTLICAAPGREDDLLAGAAWVERALSIH